MECAFLPFNGALESFSIFALANNCASTSKERLCVGPSGFAVWETTEAVVEEEVNDGTEDRLPNEEPEPDAETDGIAFAEDTLSCG